MGFDNIMHLCKWGRYALLKRLSRMDIVFPPIIDVEMQNVVKIIAHQGANAGFAVAKITSETPKKHH